MEAIAEENALSLEGKLFKRNSKVRMEEVQVCFSLEQTLVKHWD